VVDQKSEQSFAAGVRYYHTPLLVRVRVRVRVVRWVALQAKVRTRFARPRV
jgi:hypothetical protein